MKRVVLWLPLAIFAVFLLIFTYGLNQPKDDVVRSHMVGKAIPELSLPVVASDRREPENLKPTGDAGEKFATADLKSGMPVLLNIFASWCLPCIVEAPQLAALAEKGVTIYAVAYKDKPADIRKFTEKHGNPFVKIASDEQGLLQLELGSSGVPETFIIDGKGIIRHQHIGEIRDSDVPRLLTILEEVE